MSVDKKPRPKSAVVHERNLELGALMRSTRKTYAISIKSVGSLIPMNRSSIQNWEHGRVPPPPESLAQYCSALTRLGCPRHEAVEVFKYAYEWIALAYDDEDTSGFHDLPHRWITTNHSLATINWVGAKEADRDWARDFILMHYSVHLSSVESVKIPVHAVSSDVYRVEGPEQHKRALFLKRYRRDQNDSQLQHLFEAYRRIAQAKDVFPSLGSFLLPVVTAGGDQWARDDQERLVVAFRFIPGAADGSLTHFTGQHLAEIESVASKLAATNRLLATIKPPLVQDQRYVRSLVRCNEVLDRVKAGWNVPNRAQYLAKAEHARLVKVLASISPLLSEKAKPFRCSAADIHPQNAFILGKRCELIFDFAPRADWPEIATVAFTAHRLCREFIRRKLSKKVSDGSMDHRDSVSLEIRTIEEALSAFVRGYAHRGSKTVSLLLSEGFVWAKAMNFMKLIDCLYSQALGHQDRYARREREIFREVVKFLSYIDELELFEKAARKVAKAA